MLSALAWILAITAPDSIAPRTGWVRAWTDHETYQRGAAVRLFFQLDRVAYVTAIRVDVDGQMHVLFPRTPWADNAIETRRTVELNGARTDEAFAADDAAGVGYIFVIASPSPFDYTDLARDDYWDYRQVSGGSIRGDPYVALTDLAARIAPGGDYDYDVAPYYVERAYDYPRFVCAQCHAQPRHPEWDEYGRACGRFRLVIYDDPAYYAYRYDRGRRVVVTRPQHPGPRFVFRDAVPGTAYVTRLQGRPKVRLVPRGEARRPAPRVVQPKDRQRVPKDIAPDDRPPAPKPAVRARAKPHSTSHPEPRRRTRE